MTAQVVNLGQRRAESSNNQQDWSPSEMLFALLHEDMPNGTIVIWKDAEGLVQIRRSRVSDGDELSSLRTALKMLIGEK